MSASHESIFDYEDPKWTAFALGELDGDEQRRCSEIIARSAELQAFIAEIRSSAQWVTAELRSEASATLSPERRSRIMTLATGTTDCDDGVQKSLPSDTKDILPSLPPELSETAAASAPTSIQGNLLSPESVSLGNHSWLRGSRILAGATATAATLMGIAYFLPPRATSDRGLKTIALATPRPTRVLSSTKPADSSNPSPQNEVTNLQDSTSESGFASGDVATEGASLSVEEKLSTLNRHVEFSVPAVDNGLGDKLSEIQSSSDDFGSTTNAGIGGAIGSGGRHGSGDSAESARSQKPRSRNRSENMTSGSTQSSVSRNWKVSPPEQPLQEGWESRSKAPVSGPSERGNINAGQKKSGGSNPAKDLYDHEEGKLWSEPSANPSDSDSQPFGNRSALTRGGAKGRKFLVETDKELISDSAPHSSVDSPKSTSAPSEKGKLNRSKEREPLPQSTAPVNESNRAPRSVALSQSTTPEKGAAVAVAESKKNSEIQPSKEPSASRPLLALDFDAPAAADKSAIHDRLPFGVKALAESEELKRKEQPTGLQTALAPEYRFRVPFTKESPEIRTDPQTDEAYNPIYENGFISPAQEPLSTFSIDVDTASYANVRRFLNSGRLPPADAVRIEELVNYFSYQYPLPKNEGEKTVPFSVHSDIAACPWSPGHQLVRIGLKGREIPKEQRPASSLVFLVDVSGSMAAENKLPLVRESLKTLVQQLDERDKISIVTYAGEAGVRLAPTSVSQKDVILAAINSLGSGGSTNGAAGITTAYDLAAQEFVDKGTNRVILCTDGDFNVGVTSDDELVKMIQTRAKGGVFLSIYGFGMGNLKDAKLEQLADKGNGQYGYIDDLRESQKVFVEELSGTLVTIAKDVKIQIDFNKSVVNSYRLIGYENRILAAEDFDNDKKDAGEIGAGHTVTALYEIIPAKELLANNETRWLTVKLRYKQPTSDQSQLIEDPLTGTPGQLKLANSDFQFAASVAAFGMLTRNSAYAGQANWGLVKELAQAGLSSDPHGHRQAYLGLVAMAESLIGQRQPPVAPEVDATVRGKYKSLLRRLNAPEDVEQYGRFNDYGHSQTRSWAGSDNLPEGYWVYVAPYWYIWGETTVPAEKTAPPR